MNNNYKINGYDVKYTYAGIDQYTIYKAGNSYIFTCFYYAKNGGCEYE